MAKYSTASKARLATVHPYLQHIMTKVLRYHDHAVLEGARSAERQQQLFDSGASRVAPPGGNHAVADDGWAYAVDVLPYVHGKPIYSGAGPLTIGIAIQWGYFLGIVQMVARQYLVSQLITAGERWYLRSGADWDRDGELYTDQTFQDLYHLELRRES